MRNKTMILTLLFTLTLASACSERKETASQQSEVTRSATLSPEELGTLGAQIHNTPDRAHELLAAHGLDEASFEKAIRAVTEDADASRRYAAAYKKSV